MPSRRSPSLLALVAVLGVLIGAGLSAPSSAQVEAVTQATTPRAAEAMPAPAAAQVAVAEPQTKPGTAQTADPGGSATAAKDAKTQDPLTRPLSEKQRRANARSLKEELSSTYKKWLNQDVTYIISGEEREAFLKLSNDEERDQFIEQFWARRNPNPDSEDNEFKDEHYRRIEYANEHFAAGVPGWRTDRGRIYITWGPPDETDAHPSGGSYQRPMDEGGGETSTYPFEDWWYRHLDGVGDGVTVEFVDTCSCGEYHMTMDRGEKDALLYTPNGGATLAEQMGLATKAQRFSGGGLEHLGLMPGTGSSEQSKEFDRLEEFAALQKAPPIKFKDLEEVVTHKLSYNLMPFDVRVDFVKVTDDTVLVPITVQVKNKDVTFVKEDEVQRGTVNIFGRVTTLTDRVAQTFEDTVQVDVPAELLPQTLDNSSVYWKALPLRPGRYRLDLVVKDVHGDRVGTWSRGIMVPEYSDDKLASSSLILADDMEKVPARSVGAGNFVIGTTKVRPRVAPADGKPTTFKKNQKVNFWMQVYNLGIDRKSRKPSAVIQYELVNAATNKPVVQATESTDKMGNVGEQLTLEKVLPPLPAGIYRLTIKVDDSISKQTINPSAEFAVE